MAAHIELGCSALGFGVRLVNAHLCSWTYTRQCSSTNSSVFKFTWRPASAKELRSIILSNRQGCNLWSTAPSRQTPAQFERKMYDNRVPVCAWNWRMSPFLLHLLQPFHCYSACMRSSRTLPRLHFSPYSRVKPFPERCQTLGCQILGDNLLERTLKTCLCPSGHPLGSANTPTHG